MEFTDFFVMNAKASAREGARGWDGGGMGAREGYGGGK